MGIVLSPSAARRLERAESWLAKQPAAAGVLVIGGTLLAANRIVRRAVQTRGAVLGWHRMTLAQLASALAAARLAGQGRTMAGRLAREAVVARVVHGLRGGQLLGRYESVGALPGLPRALASTIEELRLGAIEPDALPVWVADLARVARDYEAELLRLGLADRADALRAAAEVAETPGSRPDLLGLPLLLLDTPVPSALEHRLVSALVARAPSVLATALPADERTVAHLRQAIGGRVSRLDPPPGGGSLRRVQTQLFDAGAVEPADLSEHVVFANAPGESRECVEIARRALRAAEQGVPFDRMAVLVRTPSQYRAHLVEAFRRAAVPLHLAEGARRPDPSGRALLALLACAAEGLSAARFAEYLSLGEVPDADEAGAPPPATERWVAADPEDLPRSIRVAVAETSPDEGAEADGQVPRVDEPDEVAVVAGALRAPRRWEHALVEAAVIGGRDRWSRRLAAVKGELAERKAALEDPDPVQLESIDRRLRDFDSLERFALPLIAALDELPGSAPWGGWLEQLSALATRSLRHPERALRVLAELAPMAGVGPVGLDEVRLVLGRRLSDLMAGPGAPVAGSVYCGQADAVRGLDFDVVFVPGLAERMFPHKVAEDPILLDKNRKPIGREVHINADRVMAERLALHLVVGAARQRLVLSWPRVDLEAGRPRVPSFYALEVLRAAQGRLPGFEQLKAMADPGRAAKIGWRPRSPSTRSTGPSTTSPSCIGCFSDARRTAPALGGTCSTRTPTRTSPARCGRGRAGGCSDGPTPTGWSTPRRRRARRSPSTAWRRDPSRPPRCRTSRSVRIASSSIRCTGCGRATPPRRWRSWTP